MKKMFAGSLVFFIALMLLDCSSEPEERIVDPTPRSRSSAPSPSVRALPSPILPPTISSPSPGSVIYSNPSASSARLIIPVVGIRSNQLQDTFNDARSEGRVHEAIDIMAPQGARVVAAAGGKIVRLFQSEKGGITIYQLSTDQRLVYYYAHLERYAEGLTEQQDVRQGDLIGYVGDTGNAGPGNYHLHFAIWQITNPKSFWNGENLNPYDILRSAPMSR